VNKLVIAFSIAFVASGCHSSSSASGDGGAPAGGGSNGAGSSGGGGGNGGSGGGGGSAGGGAGGGSGGGGAARWADVRPDEYFLGLGAVGAELWGLGGIRGTNVRHLEHRAAGGTWTDTAYPQPDPVPLQVFLPLAADNMYAISFDGRTVYHWGGSAWSVLFPADDFSFGFLAGSGGTVYLGSGANAQTWGGLRVSTDGAPFTTAIDGSGQCRDFLGGFAGNGVAVFSNSILNCSNSSEIGAQLWISTGGDFEPYDNPYNSHSWWAASPNDIYAGWTASVAHLHDHVWNEEDLTLADRDDYVVALAGTSAQDVWALTHHGFVCHSDGSGSFGDWSCEETTATMPGQYHAGIALALTAPGDPWVVLDDDRLYHRE